MALGASYATLAQLKKRLGIEDNADDDDLTGALAVASRGIEFCTHRQFNDAGSATARLYHPISEHLLKVDDFWGTIDLAVHTGTGDGTYTTSWNVPDFELWPLNGVTDGVSGWPFWKIKAVGGKRFDCRARRASVQVTARWGWEAVPDPVHEACLILAEDLFKLRDTPFGAGGYAEFGRIKARENPNVWMRIAPYRRDAVLAA